MSSFPCLARTFGLAVGLAGVQVMEEMPSAECMATAGASAARGDDRQVLPAGFLVG